MKEKPPTLLRLRPSMDHMFVFVEHDRPDPSYCAVCGQPATDPRHNLRTMP